MDSQRFFKITFKHHIIFWTVYFLFNTYRWGRYFDDFSYSFKTNLIGFPIHMALCYLTIYVIMPKFVYKRKYLMSIILIIIAIFTMVILKFNLTYYLVSQNVWPEGPEPISSLNTDYIIDMMIGELYVVTFVTAIKSTIDWIKEHKKSTDLEKSQLETELLFLRSQVSPHFFFNTLNNIYSLSLEGSKKTPKIILKLSELMRYLLYETKEKRQELRNEIICIQNYLDLERIRYGDFLTINMNITGDIEDKTITPMLLLSFIENAFKHGANKSIEKVKIDIDFKIQDDFLYFRISNPIPNKNINEAIIPEKKGGIGLKNVKKRLELGYKESDYTLTIDDSNQQFTVELKIKV
ncbi:Histidine kinase [Tenacibaculum xiamenense]